MIEANLKGNLRKDSNARVLMINYDSELTILTVVSSDNKVELFKVSPEKEENQKLIKKIIRQEKKKQLKRKR